MDVNKKIRVGMLFGGKSAEHEISLLSAKSVIDAMDKSKYEVVLIGIDKSGEWFLHDDLNQCLLNTADAKLIHLGTANESVAVVPKEMGSPLVSLSGKALNRPIDVVFPILHGTCGEDGTVQGLLKLANIPFVGAGVLASAVGMDKDVMKRLLRDAGIPVAKFLTFTSLATALSNFNSIKKELGLPFFVKPANLGSSVGVSKIKTEAEFHEKIALAFKYDRKILIEEYIPGREIECSVLGNEDPIASLPGEVIPQHEFYSYEAKYLDENGAFFEIPARLSDELVSKVQALSIQAFTTLCCEGMARVDMFLKENGEVVLNEINTIPGFTRISMYPKMWAVSGLPYSDLIDKLIELALERFEKEHTLRTTLDSDIKALESTLQDNRVHL
jgi:D-alanine-D-alanine ligase